MRNVKWYRWYRKKWYRLKKVVSHWNEVVSFEKKWYRIGKKIFSSFLARESKNHDSLWISSRFVPLLKNEKFSNTIPLFFKRYHSAPMRYHFFQTIPLFSIPPIPLYIFHQKFQISNKMILVIGIFRIQRKSFCLNFLGVHGKNQFV
jgi:hypothetical protein